jgi:hypothetical protein
MFVLFVNNRAYRLEYGLVVGEHRDEIGALLDRVVDPVDIHHLTGSCLDIGVFG